jgi:hypothetical protein
MALHLQLNDMHHFQILNVVPLDSHVVSDLSSAVLQPQVIPYCGLQYFSTLSLNRHFFPKKQFLSQNVCFDFLYKNFLKHFIIRKERELIKNISKSACQRTVFLFSFTRNLNFPDMFRKYTSMNFNEIPSTRTDGRTDRQI